MTTEKKPPSVASPKQGGETRDYSWVERAAWSDRMLETLIRGEKGRKWFSLIDKVYSERNIRAAWAKVRANRGAAGIDRQSVSLFEEDKERNLSYLRKELMEDRYRPQPVRRRDIPKPGTKKTRPLGIPAVRDRIVQQAVRQVIEPIFEVQFVEESYGFRPQRGCKDALRRVQGLLNAGYTWVVDADYSGYFDSIDWDILMDEVRKDISDGRVLKLLEQFLQQDVMVDCKLLTPVQGTPQGGVISPLLANIFLHPVDVALKAAGHECVRYADDLVILCRTEADAQVALADLRMLSDQRRLSLHPEKTVLVDATQHGGFDFLGYHFERGMRWPRKKSQAALKDRVRSLTPRTSGLSMEAIVGRLNRVLRGWYQYFKHSITNELTQLDKWIRMRLRSILRKRHKGRGHGRGFDHLKWPNAYFRKLGLFFLAENRVAEIQSRRGTH